LVVPTDNADFSSLVVNYVKREKLALSPGVAVTTDFALLGNTGFDGPAVLVRVETGDWVDMSRGFIFGSCSNSSVITSSSSSWNWRCSRGTITGGERGAIG
jgi:regulation of enolase protein 1 (concanavalin A-like superfamily)